MEATLQGLVRFSPLGYQHCVGELRIQERSYLSPQSDVSLAVLIVFHQRTCHIHTEAVTAHADPEPHDIFHLCKRCLRPRIIGILLPVLCLFIKSVIECRLVCEKVHDHRALSLGDTAQTSHVLKLSPGAVGPDITVGKFIAVCLTGLLEPGMCHGGMSRHQI